MRNAIELVERGLVPDWMTRVGIRRLLRERLRNERKGDQQARLAVLLRELQGSPIAESPEAANEQHYEVPPAFFDLVLGRHRKYSCAWWGACERGDLDAAEAAMLALTCERAELEDGMDILELGCGWGSLTLWMAEHFPRSHIVAVSNSASQCHYIDRAARERGLRNVSLVHADVNAFSCDARFDRVVSVEMFEHMRNYAALLERIHGWLRPHGKLFVHIFTHQRFAYPFETEGDDNWMGRHFFTGGIMPSADLLAYFQDHVELESRWRVDGRHYQRTCEAWLTNLDRHREQVRSVLAQAYGVDDAERWVQRWRMFFMACAELFGYAKGREWQVHHYLFRRRSAASLANPKAGFDLLGPDLGLAEW